MRYKVLASDYDGTIATDGVVSQSTVAALRRFREAGGELVLVTGREIADLRNIFPELKLFQWIVAENGAVLFDISNQQEILLAQAPSAEFISILRIRGVAPLYIGRVIVASSIDQASLMEDVISELGLQWTLIPNKEAAMLLPNGCDKATGLQALFARTGHDLKSAVGVGDAENDIPLLAVCGLGVALSNALPLLKDRANWVMSNAAGDGIAELIERLLKLEGMPEDPI